MASLVDDTGRRRIVHIRVVGFEISEDHTTYTIEVQIDKVKWQVKRRFKEFHYLHETLCKERAMEMKSVAKFPPKKAIGHLTVKFVQDRQKRLSAYLQSLATVFDKPPQPLTKFLLWEKYEIQGITGCLTEYLFEKGDTWLDKGYPFEFSVLQLYAINQRMRLPAPTCELGNSFKSDFGHLLDFVARLESVKLVGSDRCYGSSNLVPNSLPYDVTPFRRLLRLQLVQVNPDQLVGAEHLRARLLTLSVRGGAPSIRQTLLPDWPPHQQLGADAPTFAACTSADFSENGLTEIDSGIRLLPRLRRLRLRGNAIAQLDNLEQLEELAELDLSSNGIACLQSVHLLVGNLKELELADNRLTKLEGLSRLYGLVTLGLRNNLISDLSEVAHLANLPLLTRLILADNPLTQLADYRVRALQLFDSRAAELLLDDRAATQKELDTVAVLQAIRRSRELSVSTVAAASSCSPPSAFGLSQRRLPTQQAFNCLCILLACPRHPMTSQSRPHPCCCYAEVDVSLVNQMLNIVPSNSEFDFNRMRGLSQTVRGTDSDSWFDFGATDGHRFSLAHPPAAQSHSEISDLSSQVEEDVNWEADPSVTQAAESGAVNESETDPSVTHAAESGAVTESETDPSVTQAAESGAVSQSETDPSVTQAAESGAVSQSEIDHTALSCHSDANTQQNDGPVSPPSFAVRQDHLPQPHEPIRVHVTSVLSAQPCSPSEPRFGLSIRYSVGLASADSNLVVLGFGNESERDSLAKLLSS